MKNALEHEHDRQHRLRREQLNATCPYCSTDILNPLVEAAHDWAGDAPPASRTVKCPSCGEETEFELAWNATLYWAKPVTEETKI